MLDLVVRRVDLVKTQKYEDTMNDVAMEYVDDSKLMVTKEVDKVEKDDYVKHKDFKYGLRIIDLPGLTRKCEGPMNIAKKYVQPGNVAILVIGKYDPSNSGFQMLSKLGRRVAFRTRRH